MGAATGTAPRTGNRWTWAVYFPRGQQDLKTIKSKLKDDVAAALKHNPKGVAFVTNQYARKHGISEQKLALLPAWEEAGDVFTEQEQSALALTEEMTDLTRRHVSDEVYIRAAAAFTERELGQVIAMALTINAWNRIGVTMRLPLPRR